MHRAVSRRLLDSSHTETLPDSRYLLIRTAYLSMYACYCYRFCLSSMRRQMISRTTQRHGIEEEVSWETNVNKKDNDCRVGN